METYWHQRAGEYGFCSIWRRSWRSVFAKSSAPPLNSCRAWKISFWCQSSKMACTNCFQLSAVYVDGKWSSRFGPGKVFSHSSSLSHAADDESKSTRGCVLCSSHCIQSLWTVSCTVICGTRCKCLAISLDLLKSLPGGSPEVTTMWISKWMCPNQCQFSIFSNPWFGDVDHWSA